MRRAVALPQLTRLFRSLCLGIMVLVLLATAALPASVMAARTLDGGIVLVLCSGDGPASSVVIDPATGETRPLRDSDSPNRCDWCGGLCASAPDRPGLPSRPDRLVSDRIAIPALLPAHPAADVLAPQARGPPASA